MPLYFRSDTARIQVTVAGITMPADSWSKMDGGDNVAETSQLLPGGMAPAVALGGLAKRSDLTAERPWSDALVAIYKQLDQAAGSAEVSATYTVLGGDKKPIAGSSVTYTGILKSVARPGYDASQSQDAMLQIAVELNEDIT